MIKVHHLKQSRSTRIIWLLEELGVDYQLVEYHRDPVTHLAPQSMRKVHPLGKAPIVEDNGLLLVESAAIIEHLLNQYAPDRLRPAVNDPLYPVYLQWLHFAEGSAMLPVLLKMFIGSMEPTQAPVFAYAEKEMKLDFTYINDTLSKSPFFVGESLTAADIMMATVLGFAEQQGLLNGFEATQNYLLRIQAREAFQKAITFG